MVGLWKGVAGEKVGQSLADPAQYDNLFPGFKDALKTQQFLEAQTKPIPAASFPSVKVGPWITIIGQDSRLTINRHKNN